MRKLLLIRHSQSRMTLGLAPDRWPLTEEGRARCIAFARLLSPWQPVQIVTSEEPKAHETGVLVSAESGIPVEPFPGLHEHVRDAFSRPDTQENFNRKVMQLFDEPDRLVFGQETANQALARFEGAVIASLQRFPEGNLAVTSHGTVMSLLVAKHNPIDIKMFWQKLAMPDLVVLEGETFRLVDPE